MSDKEPTDDSGKRGLRGFKFSPIHVLCPIKRIKVRRLHYRVLLVTGGVVIYACHVYFPEFEIHVVVLVNTLFALDPTV